MVAILFLCWSHQWKLSGFAVTAIQSNFRVNIVCNGFGFYIILFGGSSSNPLYVFMRINCIEKSRFWFSLFQCNQTFFCVRNLSGRSILVCVQCSQSLCFFPAEHCQQSIPYLLACYWCDRCIFLGLVAQWPLLVLLIFSLLLGTSVCKCLSAFKHKCLLAPPVFKLTFLVAIFDWFWLRKWHINYSFN